MLGAGTGATTAEAQPSESTINVAGDTFVRYFLPYTTAGSDDGLGVDGALGNRALVQFDSGDIGAVVGNRGIVEARLEFNIKNGPIVVGNAHLAVYRMTRSWTEPTASWSNTFTILNDGFAQPATDLIPCDQTGTVSFDVTQDVVRFLEGAQPNYGWMVGQDPFTGTSCSLGFSSRESPNGSTVGPRLVLTVAEGEPDDEVVIAMPEPGVLVVDATDGHGVLDVPDEGKTFATRLAFQNWAVANLNALRVTGEDGLPAIQFREIVYGEPTYVDVENQELVEVDEVGSALLGGKNGILTIGSTQYCLREDGCGLGAPSSFQLMSVPTATTSCDGQNFCIRGRSWVKHRGFLGIHFSSNVGGETEQTVGGYQEKKEWCHSWKGWLVGWFGAWRCTTKSGSNTLRVRNTYGNGSGGSNDEGWLTKSNVTRIRERLFGFFYKVKFGASLGGGTGCTEECEIKGVCVRHHGLDNAHETMAETGDGDRDYLWCADEPVVW